MKQLTVRLMIFLLLGSPVLAGDIYFGDLHTHSNFSADAVLNQTLLGVNRDPEAACSYARVCAQVDFYGQSDHAEMLDGRRWQQSQKAVSECNARFAASDASSDPEMVVFQGFEWTASAVGDKYWGHKNVFFRNDTVPPMPTGAYIVKQTGAVSFSSLWETLKMYGSRGIGIGKALGAGLDSSYAYALERCNSSLDQEPDEGCVRVADDPARLWDILRSYYKKPEYAEKGYDVIAIPHGTAWGMAKVATDWDIQMNPTQHSAEIQRLVEVYSGHGNSEEYRDHANREGEYESCYVRAGRLAWAHCRKQGEEENVCRGIATEAARKGAVSFQTTPEDWGQCGECKDCFQPAERYAANSSVQAGLAKSGFGADGKVETRFHFGFIAATDDHASRPASVMEDKRLIDWGMAANFVAVARTEFVPKGRNYVEAERAISYFYPGGLVAVHAESRTRDALFDSLQSRAVYGTSGPRIRLWFSADLDKQHAFMGQRVTGAVSPRFSFEIWGGPEELQGCSAATYEKWGRDLVRDICLDTCYNPSPSRVGIDRVEVIKITPQISPDEKLRPLIQDPYLVIRNEARREDGSPTAVFKGSFADPGYGAGGRDALYYIRAIQTPTPAVNGKPMQGENGTVQLCPGDNETSCSSLVEERAWSSPVYVDFRR